MTIYVYSMDQFISETSTSMSQWTLLALQPAQLNGALVFSNHEPMPRLRHGVMCTEVTKHHLAAGTAEKPDFRYDNYISRVLT